GGEERKTVLGLGRPAPHRVPTDIGAAAATQDGPVSATLETEAVRSTSESGQGMPSGVGHREGSQLVIAEDLTTPYQCPAETEIVPLGQLHRTYLVAQVGHELQIIDQHTAHERVLFERLWRHWQSREIPSQPLLIPEPVELSAQHGTLLRKHLGELERLGL